MGLRETLEAAPPGPWRAIPHVAGAGMFGGADAFVRAADDKTVATGVRTDKVAELIALAPELAALALDQHAMIRAMRRGGSVSTKDIDALLARLDQLGKEQR